MTGHIKGGNKAHQREKIYAILREIDDWVGVYKIGQVCWKSEDETIKNIKPPTIRRCLQELRDNNPPLAKYDPVRSEWYGVPQ